MAFKFSTIEPFQVLFQDVSTTAVGSLAPRAVDPTLPTSYTVNATSNESVYNLPTIPSTITVNNISLISGSWVTVANPALTDGKWEGTVSAQVYWSGTVIKTRQVLSGTAVQAYSITQAAIKYECEAGSPVSTVIWRENNVDYTVKRIIYNNVLVYTSTVVEPPVLEIRSDLWGYGEFATAITNTNNFAVMAIGRHYLVDSEGVESDISAFNITIAANSQQTAYWACRPVTGRHYVVTECYFVYEGLTSNTEMASQLYKDQEPLRAPVLETATTNYVETSSTWSLELKVSNPNDTAVKLYLELEDDGGDIVIEGLQGTLLASEQNRTFNLTGLEFATGDISVIRLWFEQNNYKDSDVVEVDVTWSETSE